MGAERLRVLLVEDNPGDARLIREMLAEVRGLGWQLEHADRLAAGLRHLTAGGFDAVLLDLTLPDGRGLDTVLRAQAAAPDVPIVVLTGLDDEDVALKAVQAGAQDYLVKGQVAGELLVRAVRYAIERRQLLRRERSARAEAERLAAERAAILAHIADGVLIADPEGQIIFINEAGRRLHGLRADELPSRHAPNPYTLHTLQGHALPPERLPLMRAALGGEAVLDTEFVIRRADGSEVVVQGSAAPVSAEDGTRLGAVLTLHDITTRRALERQKDEFLSNVSHDLRTPLAAIKASIGVVLANEPDGTPAPLHRMLVNIDQAADRMNALVADLLELARLQAGRIQLRLERVDLCTLAQHSAAAIEPLAAQRGQHVQLVLPAEAVPVRADPARLERAVLNLLTNAQKYGREGGTIRLEVVHDAREGRLGVHDDGPGIAPDEQERIFERFYRPDSDQSRRTQGAGLGLPIARAMVELHGGRLWVESALGAGTAFWIALPLQEPAGS